MNKKLGVFWTVGLLALLGACQVQWISLYDEQTDRNVTAYQKKMNSYFERLKDLDWPACSYDANKDFYADAMGDATVILTRAESLQNNSQTVQQTTALKNNLIEVRDTQQVTGFYESDHQSNSLAGTGQETAVWQDLERRESAGDDVAGFARTAVTVNHNGSQQSA